MRVLMASTQNYESSTIFLVTGFQYLSTAFALSFGYEFRRAWYDNFWLIGFLAFFAVLHFWVTLVPGHLSCFWRVNCDNDHVLYSMAVGEVLPIQNHFHSTIMPASFRKTLIVIMLINASWNVLWEFVVVNGTRRRLGKRLRSHEKLERLAVVDSGGEKELA